MDAHAKPRVRGSGHHAGVGLAALAASVLRPHWCPDRKSVSEVARCPSSFTYTFLSCIQELFIFLVCVLHSFQLISE